MVCIAVIPARGDSKELPNKNIFPIAGKPLLAWTIETALQSQFFTRVIVSTDDAKIAEVARKWGGECPFQRPAELARDETSGIEVILHTLNWLAEHEDYEPDFVMVLQPTSPLRTIGDIHAAFDLMIKYDADAVVSVRPVKDHPYLMKKVADDGCLTDFLKLDHRPQRRQDLPSVFILNGAIYLVKRDIVLQQRTFYTKKTYAYVMPHERSVDIDTISDLKQAEAELLK